MQFGFTIEKNEIIFGQGNVDAFVNEMDKQYSQCNERQLSKEGKLN
jgi:hypothetical protein